MSLKWTVYIAPKAPKGAQKRKVIDFVQTFKNNMRLFSTTSH